MAGPEPTRRQLLALAAALVAWPAAGAAAARRQQRLLFGSPCELLLPAQAPDAAADEVWHGLAAMNAQWNAWKPGALTRLNAGFREGRPVRVAPALQAMIRRAAWLEQASRGLFNPGIGGLVGAWGFHDDLLQPGPRPAAAALARWQRAAPSLAQIEFRGAWARSRNPALQLDFGAYAKGVAIDWALQRLQQRGVQAALLNLGGNLAALGAPAGRAWQVGVRNPLGPGLAATLATRGQEAVVTSGSYERYRLLDGEPATHILDPLSGQPAPAFVSVTVVHASAALADAAATALLVAGPSRWQPVAEALGVDQVLLIDRHGRHTATPRLAARLQAGA